MHTFWILKFFIVFKIQNTIFFFYKSKYKTLINFKSLTHVFLGFQNIFFRITFQLSKRREDANILGKNISNSSIECLQPVNLFTNLT